MVAVLSLGLVVAPGTLPAQQAQAAAKTYYVSTTGSDANSGLKASPFRTIGKAVSVAQAGDAVLVRAGTYSENVKMVRSGTSSGLITIKNYPGEHPKLNGGNTKARAFDFNGQSYIRVQGFEVTGYNSHPFYIEYRSSTGNEIVGNHIHHNGRWDGGDQTSGVRIRYAKGTKVIANRIHHISGFGVRIQGPHEAPTNTLISSNDISYPGIDNIYVGSQGVIIEDNHIHHNLTPIREGEHADNVQVYLSVGHSNTRIIIRNNLLGDVKSNQMMLSNAGGMLIYNNVVLGGNATGINIKGAPNTKVFNNTIIGPRWNAIYVHASNDAKSNNLTSSNVKVYNNIAKASGSGDLVVKDDGSKLGFESGNNILGADVDKITFIDRSKNDYRLAAGSNAIDKGYANTDNKMPYPATDKDGKSRIAGGVIDVGAYEYGGNPALGSPTTVPGGSTTETTGSVVDTGTAQPPAPPRLLGGKISKNTVRQAKTKSGLPVKCVRKKPVYDKASAGLMNIKKKNRGYSVANKSAKKGYWVVIRKIKKADQSLLVILKIRSENLSRSMKSL